MIYTLWYLVLTIFYFNISKVFKNLKLFKVLYLTYLYYIFNDFTMFIYSKKFVFEIIYYIYSIYVKVIRETIINKEKIFYCNKNFLFLFSNYIFFYIYKILYT